jgi:RNase P subunit RPR2
MALLFSGERRVTMSTAVSRLVPSCTRCKAILIEPEWSEIADKNEIVYFWRCAACGHQFETKEHSLGQQLSKDELAEEFLPNLVVE